MIISNDLNLPEALVQAVANDPYDSGLCDISVTTLIGPPQIRHLKKKYGGEITEDASDRIWSLLGQAVHSILDRALPGEVTESRLFAPINGWIVSGQFDNLSVISGCLSDYKVTSVWAVKGDIKEEWAQQLNCLAELCRINGHEIKSLSIVAILRDWNRHGLRDSDYPRKPVVKIDIPLWPQEKISEYMLERVKLHQLADQGIVEPCSDRERWFVGEGWAIKKGSNKRALRVFDDENKALQFVESYTGKKAELSIEHRHGTYGRCENYCSCRKFCSQAAESSAGQKN